MKKIVFLGIAILGASCSSQLYVPTTPSDSQSLLDLKKGRELYVKNCANCHDLHLPNQYKAPVWKINLDKMQERSKITDLEKQLIYEYIVNAPK